MAENTKSYEGMFLLDAGVANFDNAHQPIQRVLDRNEAEVLAIKPWDDRRLAYEIKGRKRGLYVLSYFRLDPERVSELEHDCILSEDILRVLILHKDEVTEEMLQTRTPAEESRSRAAESDNSSRESGSDNDSNSGDEAPTKARTETEPPKADESKPEEAKAEAPKADTAAEGDETDETKDSPQEG